MEESIFLFAATAALMSVLPSRAESMTAISSLTMSSASFKEASASNVAYFQYPISMQEDKIELSGMDGCLNVKNISNDDIKNTVYVYYKNYDTMYFKAENALWSCDAILKDDAEDENIDFGGFFD